MEFTDFLEEWHNATPYIVAKTSGSTGAPKTIRLDKDFVRQSASRTNSFFDIYSGSHLHSCVAADYIGGKMMAVRADVAGCRFTWEKPSNRPLQGIGSQENIDLIAVVPSQMLHILDNLSSMPSMNAIIIGGSAINHALHDRICNSGLNAYETYGMTETSSHIALRKIEANNGYFETLGGINVSIDERECLVIGFDSGERFVTNDIAEVLDSRHFKIKGRFDDVIITGGKKVNPVEVENKLSPYIQKPYVITSVPDVKWGSAIVLRIEDPDSPKEDTIDFTSGKDGVLMKTMREILEPHEVPKKIERMPSLPRTHNGKIIR